MPHHDLLTDFTAHSDERGCLVALEKGNPIPFSIARVYYIYNTHGENPRGFHAHHCLEQVLICLRGTCTLILDNGNDAPNHYRLNSPTQGLYIGHMTWREIRDISKDCIILVLASASYDKADYIYDYKKFKQLAKKR